MTRRSEIDSFDPIEGSDDRSPDPSTVVAPVIRDLTARRLARAIWGLTAVAILALIDLVVGIGPGTTALAALAGAVLAAGSMLARGMAGVRRAFGDAPAAWMRLASVSFAATHLFALWIFGYQGVFTLARRASGSVAVLLAIAYLLAGIRLMIDLTRISAVAGLARIMSAPASEEEWR